MIKVDYFRYFTIMARSHYGFEPGTKKMLIFLQVIFIGLLIDLLAFTLILPLLPGLLDHYKRHDESGWYAAAETRVRQFGATVGAPDQFIPVLFGGLIGSMFSFLQFLASPVVGGLSDYYGRRLVFVRSSYTTLLGFSKKIA